jgi:hypothetical protein
MHVERASKATAAKAVGARPYAKKDWNNDGQKRIEEHAQDRAEQAKVAHRAPRVWKFVPVTAKNHRRGGDTRLNRQDNLR